MPGVTREIHAHHGLVRETKEGQNLAMDLVDNGRSGRMVALRDGVYTHVPLNRVISGVKRVDVDEMYDREQYRPKIADMMGKPMFLY